MRFFFVVVFFFFRPRPDAPLLDADALAGEALTVPLPLGALRLVVFFFADLPLADLPLADLLLADLLLADPAR